MARITRIVDNVDKFVTTVGSLNLKNFMAWGRLKYKPWYTELHVSRDQHHKCKRLNKVVSEFDGVLYV